MKYRVLQRSILQDLIDAVNWAIKDGWQPVGGVAVVVQKDRCDIYCQAMVLDPEPLKYHQNR
jgi:hypothetical protein